VARPMLAFFLDMSQDDAMSGLLWSVIVGYAWSVWHLDRLWRHAGADGTAGRRAAVVDMRRSLVARRHGDASAVATARLGARGGR
jgi:hypothetical protein